MIYLLLHSPKESLSHPCQHFDYDRFIILQTVHCISFIFSKIVESLRRIPVFSNMSLKQLRHASKTPSLFLRLKTDFRLNLSRENGLSSFLKCYINLSFRACSSSSFSNFVLLILFVVGTNLNPFDKREVAAEERTLPQRFVTFLLTNLTSILPWYLSSWKTVM